MHKASFGEGSADQLLFGGGWTPQLSPWGASDMLAGVSKRLKGLARKPPWKEHNQAWYLSCLQERSGFQ